MTWLLPVPVLWEYRDSRRWPPLPAGAKGVSADRAGVSTAMTLRNYSKGELGSFQKLLCHLSP